MPHARTTAVVAVALLTAVGCVDNRQHGETFVDQEHPTSVGLVAQAQAAAGAKQDGTLYDCHFRGRRLSALGQGKLDLILKGTAVDEPVDVYLDLPAATPVDLAAARRATVAAFLQQHGVPADQVAVAAGPNPHLTTPTAYNLTTVYRDGTPNTGVAADLGVTGGLGANGPGGTTGK